MPYLVLGKEVRGSYLVTIEWKGLKKSKPLAFIGKGVCFDTGGIFFKACEIYGGYDL